MNLFPEQDALVASYSTGIIKTIYNFISPEIGSINNPLFISEISPSRTEIRLFPLRRNQPPELIKNLEERFKVFTDNDKFREDFYL